MAWTAASSTSGGPSVSGKPCPRLTLPVEVASADISAKMVVPKPCSLAVRNGALELGTPPAYDGVPVEVTRGGAARSGDHERAAHAAVDLADDLVGARCGDGEGALAPAAVDLDVELAALVRERVRRRVAVDDRHVAPALRPSGTWYLKSWMVIPSVPGAWVPPAAVVTA